MKNGISFCHGLQYKIKYNQAEHISPYRRDKMIDIIEILDTLGKERPVFHSEADFQHALAWIIHEKHPEFNVRLEKRLSLNGLKIYVDIFVYKENGQHFVVIETKYKTKRLSTTFDGEEFELKDHSAQDCSRYDFLKDIWRIERILRRYRNGYGIAIFLTNDPLYWLPPRDANTIDELFRIHEGRMVTGILSWREGTSKGTMSGREEPITLAGEYRLKWRDFSRIPVKYGKFRYLLVQGKGSW